MKDITIIIPIHKLDTPEEHELLRKSLESVERNKTSYNGNLNVMVVSSKTALANVNNVLSGFFNETSDYEIICNDEETDFCSQINVGAKLVKTEFFSILEFDDEYTDNWFKMFSEYYYSNEDVSVFLPINVQHNPEKTKWQYGNEIVWATSFSNEVGFIDFDCLENCSTFNLTGGIFNTNDFNTIGGLKSSIKVSFNYEFLLRLTNKKLKAYVIPKEGYKHVIGRENSLIDHYNKTMENDEIQKWFNLAKREYMYVEDRKTDISFKTDDEVK